MGDRERSDRVADLQSWLDRTPEDPSADDQRAALEALFELKAQPPLRYRMRLARLLIHEKDFERALATLNATIEDYPDNIWAKKCLSDLYWASFETDKSMNLLRALALENPHQGGLARLFIARATEVGGPAMVSDFLRALQAAGAEISDHAQAAFFHRLRDETLVAPAAERIREGVLSLPARVVLNVYADMGAQKGAQLHTALAESADPDANAEAARLDRLLQHAPKDDALKRPAITEKFDEIISWAPEPGPGVSDDPEGICLIFSGAAHNFGVPSSHLDRYLAARGLAAVYLRDPKRLVGQAGLPGLGDTPEAAALALREQVFERGYRRIYILGFSLGGFWGFSYGLIMQAHAMASFGGMTYLDRATMAAKQETRAPHYAHRLWRWVGQDGLNLQTEFVRRAHIPKTHLFFSPDHPLDAAHAGALADFDNVFLHPTHGVAGHDVSVGLKEIGLFQSSLDHLFSQGAAPRPDQGVNA